MKKYLLPISLVLSVTSLQTNAAEFFHKCIPEDTNEITQLACNIYFEARGEGVSGMLAVAFNTLNRVDDYRYPNTVKEVVWENKQYSWTNNKNNIVKDYKSYIKALQIASKVYHLDNKSFKTLSPIGNSLWYHNDNVSPFWAKVSCETAKIGNHIYYNCIKYK